MRLTGGTPFASPMNFSSNRLSIFLDNVTDPSQLTLGTKFVGGFFTDADASFLSSVLSTQRLYYVYGDGNGPLSFNGKNYYNIYDFVPGYQDTYTIGLGVEATTANFAGGSSLGQVTTFTVVVPEPTTTAMALVGVAYGSWEMMRRRRRTCRPS
jgi:hypothetical protein